MEPTMQRDIHTNKSFLDSPPIYKERPPLNPSLCTFRSRKKPFVQHSYNKLTMSRYQYILLVEH